MIKQGESACKKTYLNARLNTLIAWFKNKLTTVAEPL